MEKHIYVKGADHIEVYCNNGEFPDIHERLLSMGWKKVYRNINYIPKVKLTSRNNEWNRKS